MKKHILFIDGNKEELNFFVEALKEIPHDDGFKCTYASSTSQALEMLKYLTPHYMFIGNKSPEVDCMPLLAFTKNENRLMKVKVFLYALDIDDQTNKMARVLGASGCIEKPATTARLIHELKALLVPDPIHTYVYLREYNKSI